MKVRSETLPLYFLDLSNNSNPKTRHTTKKPRKMLNHYLTGRAKNVTRTQKDTLREKCPNTELFSGPYFPAFGLNTEK